MGIEIIKEKLAPPKQRRIICVNYGQFYDQLLFEFNLKSYRIPKRQEAKEANSFVIKIVIMIITILYV